MNIVHVFLLYLESLGAVELPERELGGQLYSVRHLLGNCHKYAISKKTLAKKLDNV